MWDVRCEILKFAIVLRTPTLRAGSQFRIPTFEIIVSWILTTCPEPVEGLAPCFQFLIPKSEIRNH